MERRRGKSTTSFPSSRTHGVGRQLKCKRRRESPEGSWFRKGNTRRERDVLRSPPENFGTSHWIFGGLLVFKSSNSLSLQKKKEKQNNKTKLKLPSGAESCSMEEEGEQSCSRTTALLRTQPPKLEDVVGAFVFLMKKKKKKETMTICMPLGMFSMSVPTSSFIT